MKSKNLTLPQLSYLSLYLIFVNVLLLTLIIVKSVEAIDPVVIVGDQPNPLLLQPQLAEPQNTPHSIWIRRRRSTDNSSQSQDGLPNLPSLPNPTNSDLLGPTSAPPSPAPDSKPPLPSVPAQSSPPAQPPPQPARSPQQQQPQQQPQQFPPLFPPFQPRPQPGQQQIQPFPGFSPFGQFGPSNRSQNVRVDFVPLGALLFAAAAGG